VYIDVKYLTFGSVPLYAADRCEYEAYYIVTPYDYFFFFPLLPLPSALLSAFLAFLAALRLQASHLSPGLKGLTALAAALLSAARPISQFWGRH
jgi:hypothetical protein